MSTHHIKSPIVGTKHYPGALAALAEIPDGSDVVLRREPGNPVRPLTSYLASAQLAALSHWCLTSVRGLPASTAAL